MFTILNEPWSLTLSEKVVFINTVVEHTTTLQISRISGKSRVVFFSKLNSKLLYILFFT